MARTELSHKRITRGGVALTADSAADTTDGNVTVNDGRVFILAENTDTSTQQVTAVIPGAVDGIDNPDRSEDVNAESTQAFGPYPVSVYGRSLGIDASSNLINLSVYQLG